MSFLSAWNLTLSCLKALQVFELRNVGVLISWVKFTMKYKHLEKEILLTWCSLILTPIKLILEEFWMEDM